jgi:hypothetical protein
MGRDMLAAALLTLAAAVCMAAAWWGGASGIDGASAVRGPQTTVSEHQRPN